MHKKVKICLPNHGSKLIDVDAEFKYLLYEINVAGLHTTQHCAGDADTKSDSYLAIDMDNCDVWVRKLGGKMRVVIRWNRYGQSLYGSEKG